MSREEQVKYAQQLWDYVAPGPGEVPVQDWQVEQAEQRLDAYLDGKTNGRSWSEVKKQVQSNRRALAVVSTAR